MASDICQALPVPGAVLGAGLGPGPSPGLGPRAGRPPRDVSAPSSRGRKLGKKPAFMPSGRVTEIKHSSRDRTCLHAKDRRFRVYKEAPGFRPTPRGCACMTYLQGDCSFRRAEEKEEEIRRPWSAYFQLPSCLGRSRICPEYPVQYGHWDPAHGRWDPVRGRWDPARGRTRTRPRSGRSRGSAPVGCSCCYGPTDQARHFMRFRQTQAARVQNASRQCAGQWAWQMLLTTS